VAIISDGSTDITIQYVDEKPQPQLITADKMSASGAIKSQTSGERLVIKCEARMTASQLRSVLDLLKNTASTYFYTPEETHGVYADVLFPIEARFSELKHKWDNRSFYYVTWKVESVDYL